MRTVEAALCLSPRLADVRDCDFRELLVGRQDAARPGALREQPGTVLLRRQSDADALGSDADRRDAGIAIQRDAECMQDVTGLDPDALAL